MMLNLRHWKCLSGPRFGLYGSLVTTRLSALHSIFLPAAHLQSPDGCPRGVGLDRVGGERDCSIYHQLEFSTEQG